MLCIDIYIGYNHIRLSDFQGPYELEGETDWTEEEPESNILERYQAPYSVIFLLLFISLGVHGPEVFAVFRLLPFK